MLSVVVSSPPFLCFCCHSFLIGYKAYMPTPSSSPPLEPDAGLAAPRLPRGAPPVHSSFTLCALVWRGDTTQGRCDPDACVLSCSLWRGSLAGSDAVGGGGRGEEGPGRQARGNGGALLLQADLHTCGLKTGPGLWEAVLTSISQVQACSSNSKLGAKKLGPWVPPKRPWQSR